MIMKIIVKFFQNLNIQIYFVQKKLLLTISLPYLLVENLITKK